MIIKINESTRRRLGLAVLFFAFLIVVRIGAEVYRAAVPAAVSDGPPAPVRSGPGTRPAVALTFNVTWGTDVAEAVLSILDNHDVKGAFFVSGRWVRDHPRLTQRIAMAGHDVAGYGFDHIDLTRLAPRELADQLDYGVQVMSQVLPADREGPPRRLYFRPPGGAYDSRVVEQAWRRGLTTVLWDVDSKDWMRPGVSQIANEVVDSARPGSIILFHAGDVHGQTAAALPSIIKGLRARNLEPIALSELLGVESPGASGGPAPQPGQGSQP